MARALIGRPSAPVMRAAGHGAQVTQMEFGRSPRDIEHSRRTFLVALFAMSGSAFLVPLGLYSLLDGRMVLGLILLGNALFCLSLMFYSRVSGRVTGVSYAFAIQAGLLALFLALQGGIGGSGVYFSFALAMMMVMAGFTGMVSGLLICLGFLGILVAGLYGPWPGVYAYPDHHPSRIVMGFVALFIMSLIAEWIRTRSYSAISHATERLSVDAYHDPLTGLLNRRGLEEALASLDDAELPAAVAIMDIDHFKRINDAHGHEAGDVVLKDLSGILMNNVKGKDLVCRWGGEEFLLLFTQTALHGAGSVMEKLRDEVAARPVRHGVQAFSITFSAGLVDLPTKGVFLTALGRADELLYQAKQEGRNRVLSGRVTSS
ncbi:GGDEF domain-containing protein [Thioalkalivibrio sulfidiphilus]|uniref:GGDEF domain-containing protein n=1 Tax=Thioalkalivibrio sulfidiphilus TaxID=1033854 RepID=UPI003B3728B1